MSEIIGNRPLHEILRPDVTPEMGFQSYEMLADLTSVRNIQQAAFLNNEVLKPELSYPNIDEAKLDQGIATLGQIGIRSEGILDQDISSAIWNSAGYRLAEMYWLKEAKRLNFFSENPKSIKFRLSAERYQDLNEQLYGKPNSEITGQVVGEVLAQARSKKLDERGQRILEELEQGTVTTINGETVVIRGIKSMEATNRLPEITGRLDILADVVKDEFAYVFNLVDSYWDEVILPRAHNTTEAPCFKLDDITLLFTQMRDVMDPENNSNISVVINDKAKTVAWDTPSMSIKAGKETAKVTDKLEMIGSLIHELGIHGGRATNGLNTELPVLGTGLYTESEEDEQPDYLTFEEGIATLVEMAIKGNTENWKPVHISHYLNTALAYEGADFRETFEITWRARALMAVPDGESMTDEIINTQRKQAYLSLIRTRRGTPTHIAYDKPLTFNKDLAYLQGKIIALRFLERVGEDKESIRQIFKGKFDPLNKAQKRLADRYIPIE
jgi:hypothetical protein